MECPHSAIRNNQSRWMYYESYTLQLQWTSVFWEDKKTSMGNLTFNTLNVLSITIVGTPISASLYKMSAITWMNCSWFWWIEHSFVQLVHREVDKPGFAPSTLIIYSMLNLTKYEYNAITCNHPFTHSLNFIEHNPLTCNHLAILSAISALFLVYIGKKRQDYSCWDIGDYRDWLRLK